MPADALAASSVRPTLTHLVDGHHVDLLMQEVEFLEQVEQVDGPNTCERHESQRYTELSEALSRHSNARGLCWAQMRRWRGVRGGAVILGPMRRRCAQCAGRGTNLLPGWCHVARVCAAALAAVLSHIERGLVGRGEDWRPRRGSACAHPRSEPYRISYNAVWSVGGAMVGWRGDGSRGPALRSE